MLSYDTSQTSTGTSPDAEIYGISVNRWPDFRDYRHWFSLPLWSLLPTGKVDSPRTGCPLR